MAGSARVLRGTVMEFYLPAGSARPPHIARGEGIELIDSEGRRYLDASSGATLGALGATSDAGSQALYGPMMRIAPKVPAPLSYRLPPGVVDAQAYACACACAQALEDRILAEGPASVLAFIMEPIGGVATGALIAPPEYYQAVRRICSRHGVLLIHDEVMSGAGRSGRFLASDHFTGARPDIVTLAKGLAVGYTPFGAVLVGRRIVDTLTAAGGFAHGHTYQANPFSCAVARAVLDTLVDENLIERAATLGAQLNQRLRGLMDISPLVGDVRGLGLLQAIELVADRATKRWFPAALNLPAQLSGHGFTQGLALYHRRANQGAYGDFLLIAPPLVCTSAQIDEIVDRLASALRSLEASLRRSGDL